MEKLIENVKKELKGIGEQGLNSGNIEVAAKLIEMMKNLKETEGGDEMRNYGGYNDYRGDKEPDREYWITSYRDGGYGRKGMPMGSRGRYNHEGMDRFDERLGRIMDGADEYRYGRSRYQDGGTEERMIDGLEKMMYAICTFVESAIDFAETPQEKEIIRKHIQKLQNV